MKTTPHHRAIVRRVFASLHSRLLALLCSPALHVVGGVVVALLLFAGEAGARVGGGQSYSSGSSGRSGGGYSGGGSSSGGSGGGGDLIVLLIWLIFEHPVIGIPTAIFLGWVYFTKIHNNTSVRTDGGSSGLPRFLMQEHQDSMGEVSFRSGHLHQPKVSSDQRFQPLLQGDPNFSLPLFLDFVQLVHVRVRQGAGRQDFDSVRAHVSEQALGLLKGQSQGVEAVQDIIFGSIEVASVQVGTAITNVVVRFETNLTEVKNGTPRQLLREERWTFRRKPGVLSPGPDRMRALVCVNCGSPEEPGTNGRCPSCDTQRTGGETQWMVAVIQVARSEPVKPPPLSLGGGGVEVGTNFPTVYHPDLPARLRGLTGRHPDFSPDAFRARAEQTFLALQQAWDTLKWERARPHQTDALFQSHRFWVERYQRFGLRNRLADVKVNNIELVKVDTDAWFESITVRIFASMRDWTEEVKSGQVVGGSKTQVRTFSEYWTFIRAVGAKRMDGKSGIDNCPSCGAPLDNVNMAGVCGYCNAKVSGGAFDWVLSRIEQDESYGG